MLIDFLCLIVWLSQCTARVLLAVTVHGERLCERAAYAVNDLRGKHQDMTLAIYRQTGTRPAEVAAMQLGER